MRLIIDTDGGIDDAQALMLALAHPGTEVVAITTVCGNVALEKVVANVFTTLDVMERDVLVYRGASQPLIADWAPEPIFGEDGLGNYQPRPPTTRQCESEHAANALVRLANAYPGELTLVCLAPQTNLALATRLDPTFPQKIKSFIFMGGTTTAAGNTDNVAAEWNIYCDPEAAYITLAAFPLARMVSWETTLQHPFTWDDYDALAALPSRAAQFFTAISQSFTKSRARPFLLPDPLAMAVALEPPIVRDSALHYVTIELGGKHTRGHTVIDHTRRLRRPPNVEIITAINVRGVFDLFKQALAPT